MHRRAIGEYGISCQRIENTSSLLISLYNDVFFKELPLDQMQRKCGKSFLFQNRSLGNTFVHFTVTVVRAIASSFSNNNFPIYKHSTLTSFHKTVLK